MIEIQGDYLEGGGQIIRTSIALSAITQKPCKIINIRKGRANPGLQAQHLEAVKAMTKFCNAETEGAELNSTEIIFNPKELRHENLTVNIPTAGSVALVLQSIFIAMAHCDKKIEIEFRGGGTHGKWAPTIGYLSHVFLPMIKKFGFNASVFVEKYGFYPRGGAEVIVTIKPSSLEKIDFTERGDLEFIKAFFLASKDLERNNVLDRAKRTARNIIYKELQIIPEIETEYVDTLSSGFASDIYAQYNNSILGSNALGEAGKHAERVVEEAIESLIKQHQNGAAVDENLADQLIPFLALVGGKITTSNVTNHCKTNMWVCEKFLPSKFSIDGNLIECAIKK